MSAGGRQWWRIGVKGPICGLLLLWIFHAIFLREGRKVFDREGRSWEALPTLEQWRAAWALGPHALWETLQEVGGWPFAISLLLMGVTLLVGVWRWRLMLKVQGLDLSFLRTGEISLVAHFFNSFLLGSTGGDLLKAYYAARETHKKKAEAVITVVIDRLVGLFSMLLFASLMIAPNWPLIRSEQRLMTVAMAILAALAAGGGMVGFLASTGRLPCWIRLRQRLGRLLRGEQVARTLEAFQRLRPHWRAILTALLLSMVLNVFCVLQIEVLAAGLGLGLPAGALWVVVPIVICLSAIPLTPNGLGIRENLYVFMLTVPAISVDATKALSLSLLAYAGSLFWSLMGGAVYLTLRETQHLADLTYEAEA